MGNRFLDLLASRPFLMADGATGTNLFAMGLQAGEAPELWSIDSPEKIEALHRLFVESGSDVILTNSFGGSRYRLKLHQAESRVGEINRRSAELARKVADAAERNIAVAGSMGPTGELFAPLGALSAEAGEAAFAEQAAALAAGGVDVLWIETMSAKEEVAAAVAGAGKTGLPIVVTMSFDTNGKTMMGLSPADFARFVQSLTPRPVAFGANCGTGPADLVAAIAQMAKAAGPDAVIIAKGNCGIPYFDDGKIRYNGTPELMADYARLVRDAGARIIGGCCGTTGAHLCAIHGALDTHRPGAAPQAEEIAAKLGPLSAGATAQLTGADPVVATRRQRRRETSAGDTAF